MAKLTPTQKFLLQRAADKDAEDHKAGVRPPGQSTTPRVDLMLDQIENGTNNG